MADPSSLDRDDQAAVREAAAELGIVHKKMSLDGADYGDLGKFNGFPSPKRRAIPSPVGRINIRKIDVHSIAVDV